MDKINDLTGQKFGRLEVLEYSRANNGAVWKCKCDCGNIVEVKATSLRSGHSKSCGCYNRDRYTKHGMSRTYLYRRYNSIKRRCSGKDEEHNAYYSEKGIMMCDEWKNSFQAFYDWAMSNGYKPELSIDRIDGSKGYSPENCRWVDMKTQANNRSTNHKITFNGRTLGMKQWAEELGIPRTTLYNRLKRGWSVEKTLTTPIGGMGHNDDCY